MAAPFFRGLRRLDFRKIEEKSFTKLWALDCWFSRTKFSAVIKNACEFALEDDATLSYAEEKQLQSVQEQIELLLPQQTQEQRPTMEQTM